jgi:RNA polymerase sigma factor (sigma-70 family)
MIRHYDLFERCKKGDAKAQRMLYDLFKGQLMGLCRRYTRDRDEAHDILQEGFIRIFNNLKQLESSEKIESWMKTIVVNVAINYYHKTKTKDLLFKTIDNVDSGEEMFSASLNTVSDDYLLSLINALPDGCRIIFNMVAIEGYSHVEVAEMLKVSEGTSRSQFHYAKQLLKQKLKCHNLAHYYEKFA